MENTEDNRRFRNGTVEGVSLNGQYSGSAAVTGSWQGKRIIGGENRGINVFSKDAGIVERYPFTVAKTYGLRDTKREVIQLDYDQAGNPWWLKLITDEVVQVGPNEYLGKVHVRLLPDRPFTIGFFTLTPG